MIRLLVTGGVCAGKSNVCRLLESFGATVLYTDQVRHVHACHAYVGKWIASATRDVTANATLVLCLYSFCVPLCALLSFHAALLMRVS